MFSIYRYHTFFNQNVCLQYDLNQARINASVLQINKWHNLRQIQYPTDPLTNKLFFPSKKQRQQNNVCMFLSAVLLRDVELIKMQHIQDDET